jgi:hypothetical protein
MRATRYRFPAAALNALDNLARFAGRQSDWLRACFARQGKSGCNCCGKVTRRANHQKSVHPCAQKDSAQPVGQIRDTNSPRLTRREGRCARHETRGGMRWTRRLRTTNPSARGRRSRVVLAPRCWRQVREDALRVLRVMVAREPVTRESSKQAVTPSRREGRAASAEPVCSCAFFSVLLHTRPRVQRAPGLPCALFAYWRRKFQANLGHIMPRECGLISSRCLGIHEPDILWPQPSQNTERWLWVPARARKCSLGRDDEII